MGGGYSGVWDNPVRGDISGVPAKAVISTWEKVSMGCMVSGEWVLTDNREHHQRKCGAL